jgi:hypothetical protein
MTKSLSRQDYELISAYLDDICSPKEHVLIEKRVKEEPELAQAMLEFKHTRRILHAMPVRRAPRNFTLSVSQVPARPQRFFLVPALNFVAMGATLLLVAAFVGMNFVPGLSGAKMFSQPESVITASESTNSAPMIITWGQGNMTTKGGLGGGGNSSLAPSTYSSSDSGLGAGAATESATEAPMSLMAQSPTTNSTEEAANPILGIAPTEDQGKVIPASGAGEKVGSLPNFKVNSIEIILAAIAVLSAVTAFLVKKRR